MVGIFLAQVIGMPDIFLSDSSIPFVDLRPLVRGPQKEPLQRHVLNICGRRYIVAKHRAKVLLSA